MKMHACIQTLQQESHLKSPLLRHRKVCKYCLHMPLQHRLSSIKLASWGAPISLQYNYTPNMHLYNKSSHH
ncbi:hypothetical protein VIGAN_07144700 [Vigna angularis var. angularis]|uniref:Uncharacterized protein n=1 Tax=Vigna angularis var. angularis TaxID=157739 RepID=A0A0S3SIL4_PHAAN|nr:hypothetical protein VIGAN_07144700 [Vigna angularis var. angularis]